MCPNCHVAALYITSQLYPCASPPLLLLYLDYLLNLLSCFSLQAAEGVIEEHGEEPWQDEENHGEEHYNHEHEEHEEAYHHEEPLPPIQGDMRVHTSHRESVEQCGIV